MKDLVIPGRRIVREIWIFGQCVLFAFGVNACAIVGYERPWSELVSLSTLPVTLAIAPVAYLLLGIVRLLIGAVRFLLRRRVSRKS